MLAISKTRPAPGLELVEVDQPTVRGGHVKIKVATGSVCGTDLHIYQWDAFSSSRIHPPRIIGHEFCGEIIEVGEGVATSRIGQFVASESHIVCGRCKQCLGGNAHVCINTQILGIDVDGGFARYAVIPQENARPVPRSVPIEVASMLDALGNAVHTACAGPLSGQTVLITGLGPIGLFAVAIAKTLGAAKIVATEVRELRKDIGIQVGADVILDPTTEDVSSRLSQLFPQGVDVTLEMSGHSSALSLAIEHTRPGGRVSLLGLYPEAMQSIPMNHVVMKGLQLQGIVGRQLWGTWDTMIDLLENKNLQIGPIITHKMAFQEVEEAMQILQEGKAGKVVLDFTTS